MHKQTAVRCSLWLLQLSLVSFARGQIIGVAATATPVINNGFLTGANLINGGAGYLAPPTVSVADVSGPIS